MYKVLGVHIRWKGRHYCAVQSGLRIRTFLVGSGSGNFPPDPDPIGTLAMQSCINKGKIFLKQSFYTFSGEFFNFFC